MSLASAFLICTVFLGNHSYHPHTFQLLSDAEHMRIGMLEAFISIALIDSERGIPLCECLLEQYSPEVKYPKQDYPKPPYDLEQVKRWFKRVYR